MVLLSFFILFFLVSVSCWFFGLWSAVCSCLSFPLYLPFVLVCSFVLAVLLCVLFSCVPLLLPSLCAVLVSSLLCVLFWLWFLLLLVGFSSFAVVSVLVNGDSFAGCFPLSESEWINSNIAIVRKSDIVFSRIAVYFNLFGFCEVFKKFYLI